MRYKGNTIRINILFILVIVFLFGVIGYKLWLVATHNTVEGSDLAAIAKNRTTVTKKIPATRGNIYDAQGNTLAQNVNSYIVVAYLSKSRTTNEKYPKHVVDKEGTAEALAGVLEPLNSTMTKEYILKLLSQEGLYQTYLGPGGNGISELVKQKIESLALPGIGFEKSSRRYYQHADFASYIIGYARLYKKEDTKKEQDEIVGELGIEGYCDNFLKGTDGSITYQRDANGYQLANTESFVTPAKDGFDVYLTIDEQIQIFLDNAVDEIEAFNPSWAIFTLTDAKTGAIVGSATYPSFNPNKLNITNYNNPLLSYQYEPGSTMKIFSFASAIEDGQYRGDEVYRSGTIQVSDYTIKDWNKTGWGNITFDTGFTYSSNVAAVNLARRLGKAKLTDYYKKLGFGEKTGIELANEYKGEIDFEFETEIASASYGQGISVTPVQMIQALTAITNDGVVLKPYVIKKIQSHDSKELLYEGKRTELRKVYSTDTVNKIIDLMDKTVNTEDGIATGKKYASDMVRLIGKTGTANYSENGRYVSGNGKTIRSFAGIFPKDNPEYILYIAVKDFGGASKDIATIVKNTVENVSKYKNIDTRESDKDASKIVTIPRLVNKTVSNAVNNLSTIGINPIIIGNGTVVTDTYPKKDSKVNKDSRIFIMTNGDSYTMPDINGWSSTEVKNFAKFTGITVETEGYGFVSACDVPAGSPINEGTVAHITLTNIEPGSLTT